MRIFNQKSLIYTRVVKLVFTIFLIASFIDLSAQCPPNANFSTIDATTFNSNDGSITVNVSFPSIGPFNYILYDINSNVIQQYNNEPSDTVTFNNVTSGNYFIYLEDLACPSFGGQNLLNISVNSSGGPSEIVGNLNYCTGSGVVLIAKSNNCSTPNNLGNLYTLTDDLGNYIWDTISMLDSASLPVLTAGTYIIEILNQDNNCQSIDTFVVQSGILSGITSYSNVSSPVSNDGDITVSISNSVSSSFFYLNGVLQSGWQNGNTISGLSQGSYNIWVTSGSCNYQDTVNILYNSCTSNIIQPQSCDPSISFSALSSNLLSGNYSYTYELSFEGNLIETFSSSLDSIVFSSLVSDSGTYSLLVINDSTGCISYDTLLMDLNTMSINLLALNDVSNLGVCDGFISIEVLGGNFPYTTTWTNSTGSVINGPNAPFNTSSISLLCEDNYCIEVTDGNPCTINQCFDIVFAPCNTSLSVTDSIDCYDGTGDITASIDTVGGGIGPISVLPGERYTFTLYELNPLTQVSFPVNTDAINFSWSGLSSGNYLVDVVDNTYGTLCVSDSIILTQPDPINIYLNVDSTSAPWVLDGSITIDSIFGGNQPYSYQWLDSINNPISNSSIGINGLGYSNEFNGGYTLIVTDTNGCTGQLTEYLHPQNAGDSLRIDSSNVTDVTCFGDCDGKIFAKPYNIGTVTVPPFTYVWRDANGNVLKVDSLGSPWYNPSHVATWTLRCAGIYTLEVFDYYGNTGPLIDFVVGTPDSMYVDLGPDFVIPCGEDTVLKANPIGGNLTNDTTLINTFVLDFNNPSGIGDTLQSGFNYLLVVSGTLTDPSGNNFDAAYDYTASPIPTVLWTFDGQTNHLPSPNMYKSNHIYNYNFVGGNAGGIPGFGIHTWAVPSSFYSGQLNCSLYQIDTSINLYNYTWTTSPPSGVVSNTDTVLAYPGVGIGTTYLINIQDNKGCTAIDDVNVSWDLYILNYSDINIADVIPCYGDSTGMISVNANFNTGFPPYYYSIPQIGSPNSTYIPISDTTFGLPYGNYVFNLQDSIGCLSLDTTVSINQPDSIWACGIGNTNVRFEIDNFIMDFDTITSSYSYTSSTTTLSGVNYLLIVEGTYGLDFFNNNQYDAAFSISSQSPQNNWTMDGSFIRPDDDIYQNDHKYEYTFIGDGNTKSFDFSDLDYSDNIGELTFTLYKLGCSKTDTVYTCSGDSTGFASISATGGVPIDPNTFISGDESYNFDWVDNGGLSWNSNTTNSGVVSNISGLPAGMYTVTITDDNGCSEYQRNVRVLENSDPLILDSTIIDDVLCFGSQTAGVRAYFSGGYGPYLTVLTLNNGGTIDTVYQSINDIDSVTIDSLIYGSYNLYVYDSLPNNLQGNYFCPVEFNFNITQPQTPLISTINLLSHVSCWGDSTGKAKVIANGGNSLHPYTYLWDNGETTAIADSLWADKNSIWPSPQWQGVTITDFNGCSIRDSIEIEHLNEEIMPFNTFDGTNTVQVVQNVQCFNACDAIATVSSVGGVLPHTYSWDIGQVGSFMPDTAFGLCFGGHDIIIEDQVGCRKTVLYQISQPSELFADAHLVDHVDCYGYNNGIAHAIATGGTSPYYFVWDSLNGQVNDTAYNLTPGIHTVFVMDNKGCMASDTVLITEPSELTISIQDSSTVYSYCTGTNSAQLYAIAFGGIEPYNYVWSDVLGQTTQLADDLTAGIYTVTVLDDRGCSASDTRDIDSVTNSMDATTSVTNVSCFGLQNGSTYVNNVIGAVAPYSYNWIGPNGYSAQQNQINFLYAGNYGVTITDSNNCSVTIFTDVQEPDELQYTLYDVISSTCFGACNGSISVNVNGGTSPYYWDGDEIGVFPFTNKISLINDFQILDLCTDDYDIYITDDNDCVGTVLWGGQWQASIDSGVVVTISPPNVTQDASCFNSYDGQANVVFPINYDFSYSWQTLSGVEVDTGTHTTILGGGDYNLVAQYSDSSSVGQIYSGCNATVQFTMPSPSQILPNENIVTISCYGDSDASISLNPNGGSGNYIYQWDTTISVPNGSTSSSITGLQEGTYTVTITDDIGCSETIEYDIVEPEPITNNFTNYLEVSCNGLNDGSVTANPSGGTPNFSFLWTPSGGNSAIANNLSAGEYTLTITDSRLCTENFDITINEPQSIISGVEPTAFYGNDPSGIISYNISCNGFSDGSAIVNIGGGNAPYTYIWSTGGSNQLETNMPAGVHNVTVKDVNDCEEQMTVTLLEPDVLVANGSSSSDYNLFPGAFDISCKGLNDGECYVDPFGGVPGTAGYMYSWSGPINGQVSNLDQIVNLYAGAYSVTVTDANGCEDVQNFVLTEPNEIFNAETHLTNYAGAGVSPVTASFEDQTISIDPYNYTLYWPNGDSLVVNNVSINQIVDNHSFNEIGINEVYIEVQNMNSGCIDDTSFIIEVQGIPEIHNVFTPNNDGVNDYFDFDEYAMKSIQVQIYNRWGELVYSWNSLNTVWDGKGIDGEDLPEGVYYYVLRSTGEDGYSYDKKGSITLLR